MQNDSIGVRVPMEMRTQDAEALQRRVNEHPFWYHTMDIAPGVTTPGWFD